MTNITVFISYSHDTPEHAGRVLALSNRLRQDGIKTVLDQYENGAPRQGWPRWMLDQLDAATFVLVVCTETYYRRFRGHEQPSVGKGVDWEGTLITQEIYDSRSQTLKFVPIFLAAPVADWVPEPLRAINHYALTSESSYQFLYDFLLGQAGVEPQPIGTLKPKPRRTGTSLTFEQPPSPAVPVDISRIIKYAPAKLIGREAETKLLSDAWDQAVRDEPKRPHVLTFVALGGEGKTSLVAKWVADLAHQDWPGCEAAFAWSFYSQGSREQAAVSSDLFLAEALFRKAEQMQAERQPAYPLLYSLRGFQYCDLLLAAAERAAWRVTLECGGSTPLWNVAERLSFLPPVPAGIVIAAAGGSDPAKESGSAASQSGVEPPHSKMLIAVSQRADTALKIVHAGSRNLLDIALNHLTLGRAALYAAILNQSKIKNRKSSNPSPASAALARRTTSRAPSSPAPGCGV